MATYALTIGGASKTLKHQSLNITETINGISTMTFSVLSLDGSYRPAIGDEVILTEDTGSGAVRIFGGSIDAPAEAGLGGVGSDPIEIRCSAVDFNELIDRRVLNLSIAAGTLKQALQALDDYLAGYGVTLDAGQADGPSLSALTFSFTTLRSAFDQLVDLTEGEWQYEIDFNKTLRMFQSSAEAAPFDVTTANEHAIRDVTVETKREEFANIVYVLGGQGQQEVTDAFTGDGSTTAFALTYSLVGHRGYVSTNFIAETLDVAGGGGTWEYATSGGVTTITRSSAPSNTHPISITYTAQFPKLVFATSSPSAAARVEKLYKYPDVFDATVLQALADSKLARQNVERQTVRYLTLETGIHPGQTQTITVAERDLDDTYIVTEVVTTNPTGNLVWRQVTAERGSAWLGGDWQSVVGSWGGGGTIAGGGASAVRTETASNSLVVGTASSAYDASGSVSFIRPSGRQYGASGDIFAIYSVSNSADQNLRIDNIIAGGADFPANCSVYLKSQGWNDAGAGSATTAAELRVRSAIGVSDISLTADTINMSSGVLERSRTVRMGDWQTYSPTWTNLTVGDGTVTARYTQIGKTVHFTILFVLGSTSSVGSVPRVSLPVAMQSGTSAPQSVARMVAYDFSTTAYHTGALLLFDADEAALSTGSSPTAFLSATAPFTWAVDDKIWITGTYEHA